jgi:hypothetical protein
VRRIEQMHRQYLKSVNREINERLYGQTAGLPGNDSVPTIDYITEAEREYLADRLETLRTD